MNNITISRLLDLNQEFYQSFATQFSSTRQQLQPGVQKILETLDPAACILDLGCGNGELARELASRGHRGPYIGLDFSKALLEEARQRKPESIPTAFLQRDLADAAWDANLVYKPYDAILAFAVLHHLPGAALRHQALIKVRTLLAPGGRFIHSEWQFLNSPRLRTRIQPWKVVGLSETEVDPGDYLLDWRAGGYGLRYVHHFTPEELAILAAEAGFMVTETFLADGEGGRLGLYQIWIPL